MDSNRLKKPCSDHNFFDRPSQNQGHGSYKPFKGSDLWLIHRTALKILEDIGMADPIPILKDAASKAGCKINESGRLCIPGALVEDLISNARRDTIYYGRDSKYDIDTSDGRVYFGPAGIAPHVLDLNTGQYRPSTIIDFYDFARVVDYLENIHWTSVTVVPSDIEDLTEQDINKAYALAAASKKPMLLDINTSESAGPMISLFDTLLGEEGAFAKKPFATFAGCPIRSPLAFGHTQSEALVSAAMKGAPVAVEIAPQLGMTAPAALAGGLVQTVAETLAAFTMIRLTAPEQFVEFGLYPFITDLRTGQFAAGSGEQALVSAAAAQICRFYDLPHSIGGGMTDSKVPDFQSGYEKGLSAGLAGAAGVGIISESAGTLASMSGGSIESLVVDNDLFGSLNSSMRAIEVNDETLSYELIKETVDGAGQYMLAPQTLSLMRTHFYYPKIADRSTPEQWMQKGGTDIREEARKKTREILGTHYPTYIDPKIDDLIRDNFPIRLSRESMSS